jgi:hypothetical protein
MVDYQDGIWRTIDITASAQVLRADLHSAQPDASWSNTGMEPR